MPKQLLSSEDIKDVDYQVKTKELLKESLFLRKYGVRSVVNNERKEIPSNMEKDYENFT